MFSFSGKAAWKGSYVVALGGCDRCMASGVTFQDCRHQGLQGLWNLYCFTERVEWITLQKLLTDKIYILNWCLNWGLSLWMQDKRVFDLDSNGTQSVEAVQLSDQCSQLHCAISIYTKYIYIYFYNFNIYYNDLCDQDTINCLNTKC